MLNTDTEVIEVAMNNKLNKSQTKALSNLKKSALAKFQELVQNVNDEGVVTSGKDADGETVT
jgi:hypothetical protein